MPPLPGREARADQVAAEEAKAHRATSQIAAEPSPPPVESATPPEPVVDKLAKEAEPATTEEDQGETEWPAPSGPDPGFDPHDWNAPAEDAADTPPPTRVSIPADREDLGHRPIPVEPVPEIPESGWLAALKYTVAFGRARWQRRGAIKKLKGMIATDTGKLDGILGRLGAQVRALGIREPSLAGENEAIDQAERRRSTADHECAELSKRQAEENNRFSEIESERQGKVAEAESILEKAQNQLGSLEAQRRALRDKRKAVDRQQKGYQKAAEERESEAEKANMGSERSELRKAASDLRRDAGALDPERQDIEKRLGALERPISNAMAKVETLKAELDSARRSLNDAKEGHRVRLAEIDAEQGRKSRELAQADAEIQRRLITLGTLINLNRIERSEFHTLYDDIDRLRGSIGARSNEIDRLGAEREAYDKTSITRGTIVLAGGVVGLITLIVIIVAAL